MFFVSDGGVVDEEWGVVGVVDEDGVW
jgi:hypothetical protein